MFFRHTINPLKEKRLKGALLTVILSILILFIFYGKIIIAPSGFYFSKSGDGLQSYYNAIYHIKHDTSYSFVNGMNYPYGEHILYTNAQPILSNTIKFISNNIVDISDYYNGILNILILFSIVIGALFLYLVFDLLGIRNIYTVFASVGIAFLSPQIHRFAGHFSLCYVFVIPVLLYLILKFNQKPGFIISLITGIFITIIASFVFYHYAFAAFILLFYWAVQFLLHKKYRRIKFWLPHLALQLLLPFLILSIWMWTTDFVADRTAYPWGFLVYKSGWEGIFLRGAHLNSAFFNSFANTVPIEWEGWAFIGHVASVVYLFLFTFVSAIPFFKTYNLAFFTIILLIGIIIHILLKRQRRIFHLTDNQSLNILLWASFIAMFISFGLPFVMKPELIHYIGKFRQFRGIGRFNWIFFYVINIATFYYLYKFNYRKLFIRITVLSFSIGILAYDAWYNNKSIAQEIRNTYPELEDKSNKLEENQWLTKINPEKYQAIVPIPYFHVGSENFWWDSKCNITKYVFTTSLKTGLPITGVYLSRTSISQTVKNLQPFMEPYKKLELLKDLPSRKPFLLIMANCEQIPLYHLQLVDQAKLLCKNKQFSVYELSVSTLESIHKGLYAKAKAFIDTAALYSNNGILSTDSSGAYIYKSYDESNNEPYLGKGGNKFENISAKNTLFIGSLPKNELTKEYMVSFWLNHATKDLIPRTKIELSFQDDSDRVISNIISDVWRHYVIIDGQWALVEFPISLPDACKIVQISLENKDIRKGQLTTDELLIRPTGESVCKILKNGLILNNRFYHPD